ncbi:MAG TPA: NINE protein [Candidatus Angelobacter sp.]|nr:NINE protein [Candidatus Angelobacter sp.]
MTEPVCPYCRMPFEETGPARVFCTACGTPHHEDCYQENGGCTVFGCSRAPADDPKLQVSQSDLSAVILPAQPYTPAAQAYVPPAYAPQAASTPQYPPSIYSGPLGLSQAAAAAPAAASPTPPPVTQPGNSYSYAQQPAAGAMYGRSQKSRSTYIVLGIFLGALGIHNFYSGYTGRAVGQLCLSVLTLGYLAIVSWIWAIIEICVVTKDSTGLDFN